MQRLRTLAKCQLVAPVWGRHFNYVSLNRDLRSLFLRINKYQVDLNCSKLAKHVHEDLLKVVLERNAHPVSIAKATRRFGSAVGWGGVGVAWVRLVICSGNASHGVGRRIRARAYACARARPPS